MSAADLLQPDPEPEEIVKPTSTENASKEDEDDDLDLEALRAAALNSRKPKKPSYELQKHPKRSNLLEIIPGDAKNSRPSFNSAPIQPPVQIPVPISIVVPGVHPLPHPVLPVHPAIPTIPAPPVRFDRPPPGYPRHSTGAAASAPLLSFPPPLPQYFGISSNRITRSRSPYGRGPPPRRRYSRSPSPRRDSRRDVRRDSFSDSGSEEEIEEEVEVTATESEGEGEADDVKSADKEKEAAVKPAGEMEEPDDVLNVHAEDDEFSSLLETSESKPIEAKKKKKVKIIKRVVKRKKRVGRRERQRSLHRSPTPNRYRRSPRRRSRSPQSHYRRRSPSGFRASRGHGRRRSPTPERRDRGNSQPKTGTPDKNVVSVTVDKSKSLPPQKKSSALSKGDQPVTAQSEAEKEEQSFQKRLAKVKSEEERERMIARRKKFQSTAPVSKEAKVISLKDTKTSKRNVPEDTEDAADLGNKDTSDTFDDVKDAKAKGGVTDLRVQLHKKRMLRGSKDRSPRSKKRPESSQDSDDLEEDRALPKVGRFIVQNRSPPFRKKSETRQIVVSNPMTSSGSDNDENIIWEKSRAKRSNIMSRLGEPVHNKAKKQKSESEDDGPEEKRIYIDGSDHTSEGEAAKESSPEDKKSKKKKKEKKKDKREKKLEKKLKKLKEEVSSLRAEKPDKMNKLLSSSSLSDILSDNSVKSKAKKKSKKKDSGEIRGNSADESEEALFRFFEN